MGLAFFELTLVVFLSVAGISIGGLTGAFAGIVIAAAICCVTSILIAQRHFEFVFPAGPVLRCATAAFVMLLILQLIPVAETFPALALRIVVGALLYGLCLLPAYFPRLGLATLQARLRGGPDW